MPYDTAGGSCQVVGGAVYPTTFEKERGFFGPVYFRFTDVRHADGTRWSYAYATVSVIGRDGSVLGSGTASKQWGQPASYVQIANISKLNPRMGRLRVAMQTSGGIGKWVAFDAELTWG